MTSWLGNLLTGLSCQRRRKMQNSALDLRVDFAIADPGARYRLSPVSVPGAVAKSPLRQHRPKDVVTPRTAIDAPLETSAENWQAGVETSSAASELLSGERRLKMVLGSLIIVINKHKYVVCG